MWSKLDKHSNFIVKFRRQHVIEPYIIDFYSSQVKVAIELDGSQHAEDKNNNYDIRRTKYLEKKGIVVLRFWNDEVKKELDKVTEHIWQVCEARLLKK